VSGIDRFAEGLAEVRLLLSLDGAEASVLPAHEPGPPMTSEGPDVGPTVRRAAVILLVSHFEGFLKALGEELVDSLSSGLLETRRIPRGVRQAHVLPRLAEIIQSRNEDQRFALLSKLATVSALWNEDAKPPRGVLRAEVITREIRNADSECIDALFSTFGVREAVCDGELDILTGSGSLDESHDIRIRLSDIVKCRNDIAHGDLSRQPTPEDVQRYVLFLEHFARRLQRKSERLIGQFTVDGSDQNAGNGSLI
jgi:hypothetical protein